MTKYRIIGNMTGNSMDAIDLVLTEFDDNHIKDICSFSTPYNRDIQQKIEKLRLKTKNKTKQEILALPEFTTIHDEYIRSIAESINSMCKKNNIDKKSINAIGFHGKTLDHNPPSLAKQSHTQPYTLQMGSGQMLADLTNIPVVYDFRSDLLMAGFEAAPLAPLHNAHIAQMEGDGCYYNAGNTSNFALIINGKPVFCSDSGPCNEYIDTFIRNNTPNSFDKDGTYGSQGKLHTDLLQKLFNICRTFYEIQPPKSGDPQYYNTNKVLELISEANMPFNDAVHTLEYFAAYIAAYTLTFLPLKHNDIPNNFILFGGGWKNPIVKHSFETLLTGKSYILPEHTQIFKKLISCFNGKINIKYSLFGEMMEARLMADLARYKLDNKPWSNNIICGKIALPQTTQNYSDMINRAAKGWENKL